MNWASIQSVPQLYEKAQKAFEQWSDMDLKKRISLIRRLRFVITENLDEIVDAITKDTGKVELEALSADILPVLDGLEYIEKNATKILSPKRRKTPLLLLNKRSFVEYMPRGVVLVISPWNYPFQLSMIPVVSAIVSGNCAILKPSEVTPLVGAVIENLFHQANFTANVVQVAQGDGSLGSALIDFGPDYIFFTGSVRTGKIVQEKAARKLIPTTLELGGKDPMIVFADANIDRAVDGALWGAFTNCGQVCMSVERLFVQNSIYQQFVDKIVEKTNALTQGSGDFDLGSLTLEQQKNIVKEHVQDALNKGAKMLTGLPPEAWSGDLFIRPIILTNVNQDMKILSEETFGPVLPIIPFDTEEEVVLLANKSNYGLSSSVWTSDQERARRIAKKLLAGNVVINDVIVSVANHYLPFGGVKQSGIGRYHSEIGLRNFCHEKAVLIDKGKRPFELQWYPYKDKYPAFYTLIKSLYGKRRAWLKVANSGLKLLKQAKKK